MPKLLQINPVLRRNTSTGKIMQEIGELAASRGWESWIAYSRGRDGVPDALSAPKGSKLLPVGSRLSVALHGLETRLFDRHGLGSRLATRRFVKALRRLDPDIIHIHNIHGYFLNYKILFRYLAECGKPVIWTVHDCWLYTGHCYHYASAGCYRWEQHCAQCPQKHAFPSSILVDRSYRNFADKKKAFLSLPKGNFLIVTVSEWMKTEMSRSFLKDSRFRVIHNGIDTEQFRPMDDAEIRERYGLGDRKVILALASIWLKEKGFDDLVRMSSMLRPDELLVMVGKMTPEQKAALPESVLRIDRTDNVQQLAALYSTAVALVNPTWQDNYPTVNLEAISCSTPVVTYRTGGSVESVTPGTGFVVEQGDVKAMLECVRKVETLGKEAFSGNCRDYALQHFRKQDRYADYLSLYDSLLARQ